MSDAPAAPVTENGAPVQETVVEEVGFKVFAGNLAYSTTDEGLKTFFAPVESEVLSAQVIKRSGNRSAGYGFVSFSTAEAAQKAVELLDKKELDGRTLIVEVAKPAEQKDNEKKQRRLKKRTGRRGSKSVPGEVSEAEANGDASADNAPAAASGDAAKPKKKKKARKPKATKDGEAPASAEGAAPVEGEKRPKARKARTPRPPRPAGEDPQGEPSKTVLFVANLGFNIDDAGLSALFTDAGIPVKTARIVRRRWGKPRKSKGYGFVDVGDEEQQKKAMEALQGQEVGGRAIAVKIAINSSPAALQTAMSDEEDDYLSDKFLVEVAAPTSSAPKTYADRRREAQLAAARKNEQNRTLSLRERERISREEGLSTSLFERAREEHAERGSENKALAMMMKMGFKPGQALGAKDDAPVAAAAHDTTRDGGQVKPPGMKEEDEAEPARRGKTGIGLRKRAASPSAPERLAKMARMAEDRTHASFRDRARMEYEERRAAGRLHPAQRTCATLDGKHGVEFNVLWLDPENPESFPDGLLDALDDPALTAQIQRARVGDSIEGRLRAKMRADALRPLQGSLADADDTGEGAADQVELRKSPYSEEELQEAVQFLRLGPPDRLTLILDYLRRKYAYCFWCGTQYTDDEDMAADCPGPDEDAHD
ncbi:uncharacterized protein BXZ73DRAFT_97130 [Epithele typhae]|uniref:uncharacterized protein n=1 Tax=Epithele typhae TaxID=378194 RepID=UPI00200874C6|nr:uncharacterized protein BXZ73DRAFT_97130 [Epithele typhae]KAH9943068.1 hypothetical protein BXZ73DRAFT_97130 [Epithele typhae]